MTLPSRLEIVKKFADLAWEPVQSQPGQSSRELEAVIRGTPRLRR